MISTNLLQRVQRIFHSALPFFAKVSLFVTSRLLPSSPFSLPSRNPPSCKSFTRLARIQALLALHPKKSQISKFSVPMIYKVALTLGRRCSILDPDHVIPRRISVEADVFPYIDIVQENRQKRFEDRCGLGRVRDVNVLSSVPLYLSH